MALFLSFATLCVPERTIKSYFVINVRFVVKTSKYRGLWFIVTLFYVTLSVIKQIQGACGKIRL